MDARETDQLVNAEISHSLRKSGLLGCNQPGIQGLNLTAVKFQGPLSLEYAAFVLACRQYRLLF